MNSVLRGPMDFEIVGDWLDIETIAAGRGVRDRARLRRLYGRGRWRKMKGIARIRLPDGTVLRAELHWYEAHGVGKSSRRSGTSSRRRRFLVCVRNAGYPVSVELNKIYVAIPDEKAERLGQVRVVDESGEDYLFSADRFVAIELPAAARASLLKAS